MKPVLIQKTIRTHTTKETIAVENGNIKVLAHLNHDKGTAHFTDIQGDEEFIFSADLSSGRLSKWEAVIETLAAAVQICKKYVRKGVKK